MKSHSISIHANRLITWRIEEGFTMIELLVTIAIIVFIATIGIVVSIDTYSRYIFRSDLDKTIAVLQKARSSAINNISEQKYGVVLDDTDYLILFRGATYNSTDSYNYKIEKSKSVTYADTCPSRQVIFAQLTGNTSACEITITDGNKAATIEINTQGGINY